MELSINAIITLVIAMTVLGLGLGVVNGIVSFGGDTLAQSIDGYQLDIPATFNDPIVVSDPLTLKRADDTAVLMSFYNKFGASCDDDSSEYAGVWPYLECPDVSIYAIQTFPLEVPSGTSKTVAMVVSLSDDTPAGTYPCILHMYCNNRNENAFGSGIVSEAATIEPVASETIFVRVN